MKKGTVLSLIVIIIALVAWKVSDDTQDVHKEDSIKVLKISLDAKNDSGAMGTVIFTERNNAVSFKAELSNLSEGEHAIHIHQKSDCSSSDGKSAGGHWNPTMQKHGRWGSENGYHKGDIGNFTVGEDGKGQIEITTNEWCIGCGDDKKDIIGKAIIVHQGTDDYTSQPSGAAGKRMSCGAIIE